MNAKSIKSIEKYMSSYDLLTEHVYWDVIENMTEEEKDVLRHIDDFECSSFYVIDDCVVLVCDDITGDVIGEPVSVADFVDSVLSAVREQIEEA